MESKRDISVVICSYSEKRWSDLLAAVESVRTQTLQPREIVVVVDHNPELLRRVRAQLPEVLAVENTQTPGLSGARNSGAAVTRGDVIAFLDDDAVASPHWLALLADGFGDPRVLGVGGLVDPVWMEGRPGWFPPELDWVVGCCFRGMPQNPTEVRSLIGCNMSVRREVLSTVGGFLPELGGVTQLPLKGDETEFCIRASQRLQDGVWLYDPRARVGHRVPAERASWKYFQARCYAEGLAKARISRLLGFKHGTSYEWSYTSQTLLRGFIHQSANAILQRDLEAFARAGLIVAGVTFAAAGYVVGTLTDRLRLAQAIGRKGESVVGQPGA